MAGKGLESCINDITDYIYNAAREFFYFCIHSSCYYAFVMQWCLESNRLWQMYKNGIPLLKEMTVSKRLCNKVDATSTQNKDIAAEML